MLKAILSVYSLFILLAVNPLPLGAQEINQAELINYSGNVSVFLKDAASTATPEEGMLLEAGDKITTRNGATAELSFNEDNSNVIRLGERTNATLLLEEEEKLEITEGEAFASVSSLSANSSFEIRTPTAVSGARGTDWVTTVTDEGTDVEAVDSVPYVRHFESSGRLSNQRTLIQPGQATTVQKFRPPLPPHPMSSGRQTRWQSVKLQVQNRAQEAAAKRMNRPAFDRKQFLEQNKRHTDERGHKNISDMQNEPRQPRDRTSLPDESRRQKNRPDLQDNENRPRRFAAPDETQPGNRRHQQEVDSVRPHRPQPEMNNELRRPRNIKPKPGDDKETTWDSRSK
jgi:hypothetical protein